MSQVVMLMIRDGLQFASGQVAEAPYANLLYCKVPNDWIQGDLPSTDDLWLNGPTLIPERLEQIFATLYGASWQNGNSDGSRYVVRGHGMRVLNPARVGEQPWLQDDLQKKDMRYYYYIASDGGTIKRALPSML